MLISVTQSWFVPDSYSSFQFHILLIKSTLSCHCLWGSFAKLKAVFSFRRRLDYYISAVYVPEVILVVLSWCTFFITPSAVPARISLSITTILTTILLSSSLNSNIPKVLNQYLHLNRWWPSNNNLLPVFHGASLFNSLLFCYTSIRKQFS